MQAFNFRLPSLHDFKSKPLSIVQPLLLNPRNRVLFASLAWESIWESRHMESNAKPGFKAHLHFFYLLEPFQTSPGFPGKPVAARFMETVLRCLCSQSRESGYPVTFAFGLFSHNHSLFKPDVAGQSQWQAVWSFAEPALWESNRPRLFPFISHQTCTWALFLSP